MPRHAKHKKRPDSSIELKQKYRQRQWKRFLRFGFVLVILGSIIGVGLASFKSSYEVAHNLKDLGKGTPVVVQIHDTGCALCQQLRRNAEAALNQVEGDLLLRIADISTAQGRSLQRQHDVPHVTLLLFDGQGRLQRTLTGEQNTDTLVRAFNSHVKRWGKKV
ncbi:MAG: putative DCC family thiol-disulfide oxidoreductase YuxK [Gammaproteobacteria bacterium]|jgi:predicted DCC family thiol-disulfide oxidoreductase YuxK